MADSDLSVPASAGGGQAQLFETPATPGRRRRRRSSKHAADAASAVAPQTLLPGAGPLARVLAFHAMPLSALTNVELTDLIAALPDRSLAHLLEEAGREWRRRADPEPSTRRRRKSAEPKPEPSQVLAEAARRTVVCLTDAEASGV